MIICGLIKSGQLIIRYQRTNTNITDWSELGQSYNNGILEWSELGVHIPIVNLIGVNYAIRILMVHRIVRSMNNLLTKLRIAWLLLRLLRPVS